MAFEIIRNDITKVKADAIVNSANPKPVYGSGTDGAVFHAAGERRLLAARKKIGEIAPGQAAHTSAFFLPAKYIIHTVGPVWQGGDHGERETLRDCYANSLVLADTLGCESIAFPLIATGSYGFPKDEALRIALEEIRAFLRTHEMRVILVVFDRQSLELSAGLTDGIAQYIDDRNVHRLSRLEYGDKRPRPFGAPRLPEEAACNAARWNNAPEADEACDAAPSYDAAAFSLPFRAKEEAAAPFSAPLEDAEEKETEQLSYSRPSPIAPTAVRKQSAARRPRGFPQYAAADAPSAASPAAGQSLDEMLDGAGETFQQKLFQLIDASGMDDVTVYKKANVDRKVFSRIRCKKDYRPTKKTAVAFAIALELDMPTMLDLLARAEIAFSPSSKFDLIVTYFVTNKIYDVFTINAALFQYDQPLLGA